LRAAGHQQNYSRRKAAAVTVPFADLRTQYQGIRDEIDAAIKRVIDGSQFVLGPDVYEFEERFAAHCGVAHCVALNSGTSALHLALLAAGIGPGDEVITVPMTFVATTAAILYCGAKPVFVDVNPETLTMNPEFIERAITDRTRALLPVHLHGLMAEMDPIVEIAERRGLVVIEDAAQAHGAEYKGKRAGSIGFVGCFSFYPSKNLGAFGEGGAAVTNDAEVAGQMRLLRDWGQELKYNHVLAGYNYRMDGIQGAVLNVKLNHIDVWTEARRSIAAHYDRLLVARSAKRPTPPPYCKHVYHVYPIDVPNRDSVQTLLQNLGITTGIHYPVPVHLQKAYAELGYQKGTFPISEGLADRLLSLPIYPEMRAEQVEEVVTALDNATLRTAA
jgi:dTDP-4-amino-4,6-dideoxygalactose transaminase